MLSEADKDLKELKDSLRDTQPAGLLVQKCRTLDQVISLDLVQSLLSQLCK